MLLIVTYRPEFEPPWIGRPHVTALTINRWAERDIEAMIDGVVGNKHLPASVRQDIIERSDGIPLFVEEMTKAVLEAANEGTAERVVAVIPSPSVAVPASLHASLMARLDRLGPAKELAQIGAAIGREFSHGLMAAVAGKPETEVEPALDRLVAAGLLFQQGSPPHATYLFKHALVQEAAYGTLLRGPRQELHARIAAATETGMPERVEREPELLAYHYAEAGQPDTAAGYWLAAGRLAARRSANREAVAHLRRRSPRCAGCRRPWSVTAWSWHCSWRLARRWCQAVGSVTPRRRPAMSAPPNWLGGSATIATGLPQPGGCGSRSGRRALATTCAYGSSIWAKWSRPPSGPATPNCCCKPIIPLGRHASGMENSPAPASTCAPGLRSTTPKGIATMR